MAIITTDWSKELAQLNRALTQLIHEEVEPMVERTVAQGAGEVDKALNKISFEIQGAVTQLAAELNSQRMAFERAMWRLLLGAAGVFAALGVGAFLLLRAL